MNEKSPMTPEEIRDMEHQHVKISYNKIEDLLYAGNNLCCVTHFEHELLSKGIAADISLEIENLDNPHGVRYFFWIPWMEDTVPSLELIAVGLNALDGLMQKNVKTYVHCKNGHGRTTTFLASYFISRKEMTTDQALAVLRERRPSGHLNQSQEAFLRQFEKNCKK
jgi:protein tyrosine phosphatase